MRPDASALLWDARKAVGLIENFVSGRTWDDYESDSMLRSAVERQFQIIGEALNRLSRVDRETASAVPDLPRIVAFRNVLVHGYSVLDNRLIWEVATLRLADLSYALDELLRISDSGHPTPEP